MTLCQCLLPSQGRRELWLSQGVCHRCMHCEHIHVCAVVIWCDMLGGVLTGKESIPWSGPLLHHQVPGERRETGQTSQCCLLTRNVSCTMHELLCNLIDHIFLAMR